MTRRKSSDTPSLGNWFISKQSPFLVKDHQLFEFRPANAIKYLRNDSNSPSSRLIVLAGLSAWMIAPNGIINTAKPNAGRVTAQQFIYEAMILTAFELLGAAFGHPGGPTVFAETPEDAARTQLEACLDGYCCEVLIALGGFETALHSTSMAQLEEKLRSQQTPAKHVAAMVEFLVDKRTSGSAANYKLEKAASHVSREISEGRSPKPRGISAAALKSHWRSLKSASPLIYAASRIDDCLFWRMLFRDPDLEIAREYETKVDWIESWLADTNDAADILLNRKMIDVWPPADVVFIGRKPRLG